MKDFSKKTTTESGGVSNRFAPGIVLTGDEEGVMITNYQSAGEHATKRIKEIVGESPVLEVCTGIGATTFVLAREFPRVYTVDLSLERLSLAKNNLKSLGLSDKVEFINGDILSKGILDQLANRKIAAVYTDVDFTKSDNWQDHTSDIDSTGPSTRELYHLLTQQISENICMKLPKTINTGQLRELADCEIEEIRPDGKLSFYLVYFGKLKFSSESIFEFPKAYQHEQPLQQRNN